MTPQEQNKTLTEQLVANLCRISRYPKCYIPRQVYLIEEGPDGNPCLTPYTFCSIRRKKHDCILINGRTGEKTVRHLSNMGLDWLITLWNCFVKSSVEQGIWKDHCVEVLREHTGAAEMDIREFVDEHWQNLLLDEENIAAFKSVFAPRENPLEYPLRRLLDVATQEISCFEQSGTYDTCAAALDGLKFAQLESPKQLRVFAWPYNLLPRNASDEEILKAWEKGPSPDPDIEDGDQLYEVEVYTPDEFAERINNNECAFGQYYVRFIEISL